jgi:hypothetical protein
MSLQETAAGRVPRSDRARIATYGSLFVLLLVATVLDVVVPTTVRRVEAVVTTSPAPLLFGNVVLEPRLVGALAYAMLALAAVAAGYLLSARLRAAWHRLQWDQRVTAGALAVLVTYVAAYALLGATELAVFPEDLLITLLSGGVSAVILGIGYARLRGIDPGLDLPDRDAAPAVGAVIAVAGAVAALPYLVLAATGELATLGFWMGGSFGFGPSYSVGWFLQSVLLSAVVLGVGSAFLYNGAVQTGLERLAGPAGAIAGVTAAFGVLIWSSVRTIPSGLVVVAGVVTAVVAFGVLAAALAATVAPRLVAAVDLPEMAVAVLVGVGVAQLALLIPVVGGSVPGVTTVASTASYAVVAAAAAVGYDRTRSVWVPALAFATYLVAVDLVRVLTVTLL